MRYRHFPSLEGAPYLTIKKAASSFDTATSIDGAATYAVVMENLEEAARMAQLLKSANTSDRSAVAHSIACNVGMIAARCGQKKRLRDFIIELCDLSTPREIVSCSASKADAMREVCKVSDV